MNTEKKMLGLSEAGHFSFPRNVTKPSKTCGAIMGYREKYPKYAPLLIVLLEIIGIK
jgi:hypothetical protein